MKKKQIKKLVSALTVASILGTSVVTPFNVLATPAEAAVDSRISPTYVAPVTSNIYMSNINTYFPSATLINGILTIDLTKMHVNYGAGVQLPDGKVINALSKTKDGVADFMVLDLRGENLTVGSGKIHVEKIDPNNKKWGNYGFDINTSSYYQYSTEFGQAVYNLFDDQNFTTLNPGFTSEDLTNVYKKMAVTPNSPEKDRLFQLVIKAINMSDAQEKAKTTAARDEVNALFTNNNPSSNAIKNTTNQAAIDKAQTLVDAVTDATEKAKIQADLDKAKELLAAAIASEEAAASKSVKELFVNNNPASNAIKDTTVQTTINDAQKLVDALTNPTLKATLQKDVDKAQSLLDARNAEEATDKDQQTIATYLVNQLFVGNTPTSDAIKDTTTQAKINDAQEQINLVKNPTVKAKLQKDLDRAQELLNAKNAAEAAKEEQARLDAAIKAVHELYTNNNPQTDAIKETTNQKAIDDAQKVD
ncbi:hypothetical protein PGRAN_07236 [Listeria grandensis FSL F6-0971]|uniref:Pesticidal crystal protein Cry1Aa domain-containing protein n=1 Tax=Listeria grandensis FSL F6-0971 TaxID=1265819 RepID=W7B8P8_9LIST|nr:toxin Cry1Ac domain D-VI-related protein [Listeria grandensis]EUJ23679.1 hypothetical protein PGRAN_07236 [Listeria grandensis FSL F6-0971]